MNSIQGQKYKNNIIMIAFNSDHNIFFTTFLKRSLANKLVFNKNTY